MTSVKPAAADEAPVLFAMREQAARWLQSRGIEQWAPGEVSFDEVEKQVGAGEWFVLRRSGRVVAGLRLLSVDDQMWGSRPAEAVYVHGLVVDRQCGGEGLGAALLSWAEGRARVSGLSYLRLDCVESNAALRRYYTEAGFTEVGRWAGSGRWHPAVLLEKRLA